MRILGIESSCDETAAAVVESNNGENPKVLSNVVYSQIDIHKQWGGVVPEVAAREHVLKIIPVINEALTSAKVSHLDKGIDAIAVASGPGLITSLMVGVETAKALAYAWNIPLVSVNHIEAHLYANFINEKQETRNEKQKIEFPALVLTVSGGHTMLILMKGHGEMETIGETRDDAAGEAFDKGAKMMGLGYPGGPEIAAKAVRFSNDNKKNKSKISFPRPMIDSPNFDFSFSGLKTALRYELQNDPDWKNKMPAYCHAYQEAIVDVLLHKTIKAAKKHKVKTVMLAGGVVANKELRQQFVERMDSELPEFKYKIPDILYTTDNAVMVAVAGYYKAINNEYTNWQDLQTNCNKKV